MVQHILNMLGVAADHAWQLGVNQMTNRGNATSRMVAILTLLVILMVEVKEVVENEV